MDLESRKKWQHILKYQSKLSSHYILCVKLTLAYSVMMFKPMIGIEEEVPNSNLIKIVCWSDDMRSSAGYKMKGHIADCSFQAAKAKNQIESTGLPLTSLSLMENGLHLLSYNHHLYESTPLPWSLSALTNTKLSS